MPVPRKQNFTITEENDQQLLEIQRRYGLAKSDSVRRGIALLYDYLCNDVKPADSAHAKVEPVGKEAQS